MNPAEPTDLQNALALFALVGGPLDRGFDRFFGQHGSLDQPPYFYIRDRRAVQQATQPIAESHDNSHSVIYQGKFWRAGKVAPNFKHEEVLDRYAQEAVDNPAA